LCSLKVEQKEENVHTESNLAIFSPFGLLDTFEASAEIYSVLLNQGTIGLFLEGVLFEESSLGGCKRGSSLGSSRFNDTL
jgi:hypothetical protein